MLVSCIIYLSNISTVPADLYINLYSSYTWDLVPHKYLCIVLQHEVTYYHSIAQTDLLGGMVNGSML